MNEVISGLRDLRKPVIAAVNGVAVGAGLCLALACDIRIASKEARFGMVFVRTGLHPDTGATHLLTRLIGTARACELMFTGDIIGAAEAARIGLVNRVVESDRLESTVSELATKIAKRAPIPMQSAKGLIYESLSTDLSVISELETYAQMVCVQTKDHAEGLAAFFDKRDPIFSGK
jgi:2-(1,2-epoxy-1,2-dihydrophenyl)acetyl-CoA isomerase